MQKKTPEKTNKSNQPKRSLVCQIRSGIKQQHRKMAKNRKGSVLHLRVEDEILEKIKDEAEARGMSLSNLVRGLLDSHFSSRSNKDRQPGFLSATYAWSDVVVAQETHCALCDKYFPAYTHAWIAQGPPPPVYVICRVCYDDLQNAVQEANTVNEKGDI